MVNQSFARHFLGDVNPVGTRFDPNDRSQFDCEIVGVVRDASYMSLKDEPKRVFYVPYAQGPEILGNDNMVVEVRSAASGAVLAREIRHVAAQLDKSILIETQTLQDHINESLMRERLLALLSAFLGAISLFARCYRAVRCDRLFRDATDRRDWHPHGPRRNADNGVVYEFARTFPAAPDGSRHRFGHRACITVVSLPVCYFASLLATRRRSSEPRSP